jgi:DNA polymerase III delta prime subunit
MNFSFSEKKLFLNELDFKNDILDRLLKNDIDSMPNLLIYGSKCSGKSTFINAFFASVFDKKFYDTKNITIELDRKIFNYKSSIYHIEFCAKEFGTNDKIFIHDFLKSYIETRNIGLDIPKIVIIKNASNLSSIAQMGLRRIIEKNYYTSKFVFEIDQLSSFEEPIKSRCLNIRIKIPCYEEIKKSIIKMIKEDNINVDNSFIDRIINESIEYNNTKHYNLKKIYGKYYYYKYTQKEFLYIYDEKVEELIQIIQTKKILMTNLDKIRDLINELYINLYPMKKLIFHAYFYFINKYSNNRKIIEKIIDLTIKTDLNICKGNKECIHVEFFFIALHEILLNIS